MVRADRYDLLEEGKKKVEADIEDIAEDVECPIHGEPMRHYVKGQDEWWSHKMGDDWCDGKDNLKNRSL